MAIVEIDEASLDKKFEDVANNCSYLISKIDEVIRVYLADLDSVMIVIRSRLNDVSTITDEELSSYILSLSSRLYFVSAGQELIGVQNDYARQVYNNRFSEVYDQSEGTISARNAIATMATIEEGVVDKLYERAYKQIKNKSQAAHDMLESLKKVLSRRMVEIELTRLTNKNSVNSDF